MKVAGWGKKRAPAHRDSYETGGKRERPGRPGNPKLLLQRKRAAGNQKTKTIVGSGGPFTDAENRNELL